MNSGKKIGETKLSRKKANSQGALGNIRSNKNVIKYTQERQEYNQESKNDKRKELKNRKITKRIKMKKGKDFSER